MKELIVKYKPVIKFILVFLLVYGVLSFAYNYYLDVSKGGKYYPDYVTNLVANQSKDLLNTVGYNTNIVPHPNEPSMKLIVKGKYLARVIEGCNGTSIIILFILLFFILTNMEISLLGIYISTFIYIIIIFFYNIEDS